MTAHNANGAGAILARGDDTPEDRELLARMVDELRALEGAGEPMVVALSPVSAVQLAGLLQLALRHHGTAGDNGATARRFLVGVREYFADCPAVLAILARGDDPSQDIRR